MRVRRDPELQAVCRAVRGNEEARGFKTFLELMELRPIRNRNPEIHIPRGATYADTEYMGQHKIPRHSPCNEI